MAILPDVVIQSNLTKVVKPDEIGETRFYFLLINSLSCMHVDLLGDHACRFNLLIN